MNKYIFFTALFLSLLSCDSGFQELNENPNKPIQVDIKSKLTATQLYFSGSNTEHAGAHMRYVELIIQHLASVRSAGDVYGWSKSYASSVITVLYTNAIKNLFDMLVQVDKEKKPAEMKAIIRIQKVLIFQRITDLYGDIPYSEAAQGYIGQISSPKYDSQEAIYNDMLKELEEAVGDLPGTGKSEFGDADLYYKGDFEKWKKLGNSVMLRLGLRLIKRDPAKSEEWVRKAISGGVMQSNDDIARTLHTNGPLNINKNNIATAIYEIDIFRMSKTIIDFMKERNDPRLNVIASLPKLSADKDEKDKSIERTVVQRLSLADQVGLPNGLDNLSELNPPFNSYLSYSEPNKMLIIGYDKPAFMFTYAQVAFNLAEAGKRWGLGGNPENNYNEGVKAAIKMLGLYGDGGVISDAKISAYLINNPYTNTDALKLINEQYWISCFLDGYEAFANWRRTNYPTLTPVDSKYGVTGGVIPRRLTYPVTEEIYNLKNYNEANARQGEDILTTRVWWDKE